MSRWALAHDSCAVATEPDASACRLVGTLFFEEIRQLPDVQLPTCSGNPFKHDV